MNDLEKVLKEIHERKEVHEKDYKTFEDIINSLCLLKTN